MKRLIVTFLVLGLAVPVSAGPIADSAAKAAAAVAAQGPQGGGPGWSVRDYFGMMLVSTGLGLTIAGLAGRRSGGGYGPSGQGTSDTGNTKMALIGAGMVGAGLALLLVHRGSSPDVSIGAKGLTVTKTLRF